MTDEFRPYALPLQGDLFERLQVRFQEVGRGRLGAVLVLPEARGVPIVRTTTRYTRPAQTFPPAHLRLAREIGRAASLPIAFNNALVERYSPAYTTMGAHSDQAQDLEEGSSIALFSCYRDPGRADRLLVVEPKEPGDSFTLPLHHHSVVIFSLQTNRRFRHKIVLGGPSHNEWLGVTLRTSRTFVQFRDAQPHLEDGAPLRLADEAERQELYRLRRRENQELDFVYPPMGHTLSESDRMPPDPG